MPKKMSQQVQTANLEQNSAPQAENVEAVETQNVLGGGYSYKDLNPNSTKTRESGFELLRIIAMLMIVMHHLALYAIGGDIGKNFSDPFKMIFYNFMEIMGAIGVDIFALIGFYFLVNKKFKFQRLIKLIISSTFYSLLFLVIFSISYNGTNLSAWEVVYSFFPIIFKQYPFLTIYCLLIILSPLLNIILQNINKKQHLICLAFILVFSIIMPELGFGYFYSDAIWFVELYFIAGYIRKYNFDLNAWVLVCILIMCFVLGIVLNQYCGKRAQNNLHILLISVAMLLLFKKLKFKNRAVNFVASLTFGVYLIHENHYVRSWLWGMVRNTGFISCNFWGFAGYSLLFIFAVYLACSAIEVVRKFLVDLPISKISAKLSKNKVSQGSK